MVVDFVLRRMDFQQRADLLHKELSEPEVDYRSQLIAQFTEIQITR